MNLKTKSAAVEVTAAREQFVYVIVAMMLLAGSSDWFSAFVAG